MNLRQLRYFCGVVEAGNARVAAEKLYVAPTAISMQLSQLEEMLGGQLFDRTSRPMTLTPLGQFVYPKACELLATASRLEREARGMAAGRLGWLSIGFTRSTLFSIVPESVRTMQMTYPDVRIELVELLTENQAASLRSGTIHLGIARLISPFTREPDLTYTPLFDDPLVAALPIQHPLADREALLAADLDTLPYISYPGNASSHFSRQVLSAMQAAGAMPRIGHEAKEIHTALALVAAGLGVAVVGGSVATNNRADIRFVPIVNIATKSMVVAIRKTGSNHPLVDSFLTILRTQLPPGHALPLNEDVLRPSA